MRLLQAGGAVTPQLQGIAGRVTQDCDSSQDPSVYTNIAASAVRGWIDDVILSVTPLRTTATVTVGQPPVPAMTRNPVAPLNYAKTVYSEWQAAMRGRAQRTMVLRPNACLPRAT